MKHYIVFLALLFACSGIQASAQQSEWIEHTSASSINSMAEEGDLLWIATKTGLVRFDKKTFESALFTRFNSPLPSLDITAIAVDHNGVKWMGCGAYIVRYDGDEWTVYDSVAAPIGRGYCRAMAVDHQNNVWMSLFGKVAVHTSDGTWQSYDASQPPFSGNVDAIHEDSSGSLWFGIYSWPNENGPGAMELRNSEWIPAPADIRRRHVAGITHQGSTLWFATNRMEVVEQTTTSSWSTMFGTIVSVSDTETRIYGHTELGMPKGRMVGSIAADSAGNIWVGSVSDGLRQFDGNEWHTLVVPDISLHAETRINCILTDRDGVVWVGTEYLGMLRFDGSAWQRFSYLGGRIPHTTQMGSATTLAVDTNGHILAGYPAQPTDTTHPASLRFTGTTWLQESTPTGVYKYAVAGNGTRWMLGRDRAIYRYGATGWELMYNASWVYTLYIDKNNGVWAGIDNGVVRYDGTEWQNFTVQNSGILATTSSITQSPDGALWFGTTFGLSKFDGQNWTSFPRNREEMPDLGIFNSLVMTSDSAGNIWLGSNGPEGTGLFVFDGTDWTHFVKIDGYSVHKITALAVDKRGHVWVTTNHTNSSASVYDAVLRYDGTTWRSYSIKNTPLATGAASALVVDSYNNIWIAMPTGIMVYREGGVAVSVAEPVPGGTPLLRNNPNPASTVTTIYYTVSGSEPQQTRLTLYNALGAEVATLADRMHAAGDYSVEFNTSALPAGVYYYRLQTGNSAISKQMIVVK